MDKLLRNHTLIEYCTVFVVANPPIDTQPGRWDVKMIIDAHAEYITWMTEDSITFNMGIS